MSRVGVNTQTKVGSGFLIFSLLRGSLARF
jgi:hypothetical protein